LLAIQFTNAPVLWIIISIILLASICAYFEFKRRSIRKLPGVLAILLLFISLLGIYLKPYTLKPAKYESVVLIGEKAPKALMDSLMTQTSYPIFKVYQDSSTAKRYKLVGKKQQTFLHNWSQNVDTLYTVGYIEQIPVTFRNRQIVSHGNSTFKLNYSKNIKLGDSLKLAVDNLTSDTLDTRIKFSTGKMSIQKIEPFSTSQTGTKSKISGYHFTTITVGDTIQVHKTTEINANEGFLTLLLAESPDFEWKFLNSYLGKQGLPIYWRTRISTNLYKEQTTNWPDSLNFNKAKFDFKNYKLIIADIAAWNRLSLSRQKNILNRFKENNGSLIFRANENTSLVDKTRQLNFSIRTGQTLTSDNFSHIDASGLTDFKQNGDYQYLNRSNKLNIGFVSLQNSFFWQLNGDNALYERYWDDLFSKLQSKSAAQLIFTDETAFVNHPFRLSRWSTAKKDTLNLMVPSGDTIAVKSRKQSVMRERYAFTYYPKVTGWHYVLLEDNEVLPFFVHAQKQITSVDDQTAYNYHYKRYVDHEEAKIATNKRTKPINKHKENITIWFYLLLLLCLAYLWIEERVI